jgi:hypothetical protein
MPIKDASIVPGLNSNVHVDAQALHVQTEDLGKGRAAIVTHVFSDKGQVVRVVRFDYSKHIDNPNLRGILPRALQVQHATVIRKLQEEGGALPHELPVEVTPSPHLVSDSDPISSDYADYELGCLHQKVEPGLWDRLVARAQCDRELRKSGTMYSVINDPLAKPKEPSFEETPERKTPTNVPTIQVKESPSEQTQEHKSQSWDAAVERIHREASEKIILLPATASVSDLREPSEIMAQAAFKEGQEKLERNDEEGALVAWAMAVQNQPGNRRYRASLLGLLARLDH